jgi:hypothetical protein
MDIIEELQHPISYYRKWRYKNTGLLLLSLGVFLYFADSPTIREIIAKIGDLGYLGAFVTGIFFVSIFTVAPASVVLFNLADKLNPIEIALIAGAGSVVGDYLILRFLKDKVFSELQPLFKQFRGSFFGKLFRTPYFAWSLPLVGAALIASPIPDEVGIGILGLSKLKLWQFLVVTFLLDVAGIFFIVLLARSL